MKLHDFMKQLLHELLLQKRTGTYASYLSTYRSVLSFSGKNTLSLSDVFTKEFLFGYQEHLLAKGCCYNTVSSYMRVLRAVRNKAEKKQLVQTDTDLFEHVYTGSEPTEKRAISMEALLKLEDADLSTCSSLSFSRDLFMLSFHLQGMSFIDLAHLRKSDLKGDILTYHRRKTGSRITLQVLSPARKLLKKYSKASMSSAYLLPIITTTGEDETKQYSTILRRYNRHLKKLAELLDISENLTSYVARHSWATAAYHSGVPTTLISEAMGHRTEEITRVYLAAFDTEQLAYANKVVLKALFSGRIKGRKNVQLLGGDGHNLMQT